MFVNYLKIYKFMEKISDDVINGGADGTRTRDPRRDRPVF